jgi:hypothetical protein
MSERYTVAVAIAGNSLAEASTGTSSVKLVLQTLEEQPRTLYADLWLSDKAFDATVKTLREVLGWQGTDFQELNEPIFVGAELDAVVDIEEYNGKLQHKVAFLNLPGRATAKPLDPAKASQLAARLNAKLARFAPVRMPSAAPRTTGARPPVRQPTAGAYDGPEPPQGRQQSTDPADLYA